MPEALLAALRPLLPAGAALAWADPGRDHPLMPGEALPGAVPARLREFSAGRAAARRAMADLGLPAMAIPHGPDRAPVWPPGMTGSITHTDGDCLAVIWPGGRGIGIDLAADQPLPEELWPSILRPGDLGASYSGDEAAHHAMAVFAIKEAVYKAQYAQSRRLLGFDSAVITRVGTRFSARFCLDVPPFRRGDDITGHCLRIGGRIAALAIL